MDEPINKPVVSAEVVQIPIEELQTNPLQPRGVISPESLVDLVDSIREHGVLEPVVVAKTPAGYQIIAGERRWRASRIVGLKTIPSIVRETTPRGMLEMALVENVQRVDLNPMERAKAFQRLVDEFQLGSTEIARRIGKSPAYVSNSLRLLSLPDALKDGLLSGAISEGHARALAAIGHPHQMLEAYKTVLKESASVRRAEDLARRANVSQRLIITPQQKQNLIVDSSIDKIQHEIQHAMEKVIRPPEEVIVKLSRSRVETRLTILMKGGVYETDPGLLTVHRGILDQVVKVVPILKQERPLVEVN